MSDHEKQRVSFVRNASRKINADVLDEARSKRYSAFFVENTQKAGCNTNIK